MKNISETRIITLFVLSSILLLFFIFYIPHSVSVAVPYSIMILLTLWVPGNRYSYIAGIVTSILAVLDIFVSPADPTINVQIIFITTIIELFGIWASVYFVLRYKIVEEIEKSNREKLGALFLYAPKGIIITSQKGEIVLINPAVEKNFGYSKEELIGKRIEMLVPDQFSKIHVNNHKQYFQTPHARQMGNGLPITAKRKDGSEFPVEVNLSYFIIKEGKYAIAYINDISERKRLDDALRKETIRAQRYLDVAPVIFIVINKDQTIGRINKEGCHLLGYNEEEVVGKNWFDNYLPKEIADSDKQYFNMAVSGEHEIVGFYESRILRKDGTQRLIKWKTSFVKDDFGDITSILSAGEDVTEKRKQEEVIRKANNELAEYSVALETSNKDLQQFSYVVSHDLQEPLRKIQSFGERLKTKEAEKLSGIGKDYIERMNNAASRMQTLINDLLMFSRITTRAHPFARVDLNEILEAVLSDLEVTIAKNKVKVEQEKLPILFGDATQIRQLFQNLISNACKFKNEETPPQIKIFSKSIDNNRTQIIFEDNGIGFQEKHLENIFNVFERFAGAGYEGSGIGLAVCKKIVQRHGGNITAQSKIGKGTTFTVTLPVNQLTSTNS